LAHGLGHLPEGATDVTGSEYSRNIGFHFFIGIKVFQLIAHKPEGKKLGSQDALKLAGLIACELSGFQVFRLSSLIAFQPLAIVYKL